MLNLCPADIVKLKGIVAAGGLRTVDDVLRISITPVRSSDILRWDQFLRRHHNAMVQWCQNICGNESVVALDGGMLTVIRHPNSPLTADEMRLNLLLHITDRLRGNDTIPVERLQLTSDPPQETLQWFASTVRAIASAPPAGADGASAATAAQTFDLSELDSDDSIAFRIRVVKLSDGRQARFLRTIRTQTSTAPVDNYYEANEDHIGADLAALAQAAQFAFQQLKNKKTAAPLPLMFPLNINNLRRSKYREKVLFEMRQIPKPICALMEPVLVRCAMGLPPSTYVEMTGYLRQLFPKTWIYAALQSNAGKFLWPDQKLGIAIDGMAEHLGDGRADAIESWRLEAARRGVPIAVLGAEVETPGL